VLLWEPSRELLQKQGIPRQKRKRNVSPHNPFREPVQVQVQAKVVGIGSYMSMDGSWIGGSRGASNGSLVAFHNPHTSSFRVRHVAAFCPDACFLFLSLLNARPLRTGNPSTRYPGRSSSGRRRDPIDAEPNERASVRAD
jgi:hypothetical protein